MKPPKPVIWNRNTDAVYAALLAAPWAGAILIYMFGDNISFKCTLFFLETDIASILWMCNLQSLYAFETCKAFCNLLLSIISLILQPNIPHVKTWKQTVRASQLNIPLCLLRYEYWLADKLLLSNNTSSHSDPPDSSRTYSYPRVPVEGMAYSFVFHTCMDAEGWNHCGGTQRNTDWEILARQVCSHPAL